MSRSTEHSEEKISLQLLRGEDRKCGENDAFHKKLALWIMGKIFGERTTPSNVESDRILW